MAPHKSGQKAADVFPYRKNSFTRGFILLLAWSFLVSGCASASLVNDRYAQNHGWLVEEAATARFHHRLYATSENPGDYLDVYIEGDGRPWRYRTEISIRPETRWPLMLRMMSRDKQAALYVTRPCYSEEVVRLNCNPWVWTHGRYSPEVVESMSEVIRQWVSNHAVSAVNLYGHSGGGSLAMLMAAKIPQVRNVVTIAGNLDTKAWTDYHDYSPMAGSLNPALVRLPDSIHQYHYLGEDDENMPASLFPFKNRPPTINVQVFPGVSHLYGWGSRWPTILEQTALVKVNRDKKQ